MARSAFTVTVRIEGADEALRDFRHLPKEASDSLRDRTRELSNDLAHTIRGAAVADSRQSALMAPTVRAVRDRLPVVQAGGTRRVGRNRKPAYKILFGSEFGSDHLEQYRPHLGKGSYWFFKTIEHQQRRISEAWSRVADDVVRAFSRG
jgi:hypothetical protein